MRSRGVKAGKSIAFVASTTMRLSQFPTFHRIRYGVEWDCQDDHVGLKGLRGRHRLHQGAEFPDQTGQALWRFFPGVGNGDLDPVGDKAADERGADRLLIEGWRASFLGSF